MPTISFSGLASGIDGDGIIKAMLDARRTQLIPFQNRIFENTNENTALEEVNTKLLALKSALSEFRNLTGSPLAKVATSSQPEALTVNATNAAQASSTTMSINSLAKAATFSFTDRFPAPDAEIGAHGLMEISLGAGDNAQTFSIEIDENTNLDQLADKISQQSAGKLSATVVNTGSASDPQYALVISSLDTGLENGQLAVNVSGDIIDQGIFTDSLLEQAQDAVIEVAGLGTITRGSNQIDDIFPGLSFDLKQAGTGPITVTVTNDASRTAEKISKFIETLNDLIGFSREENKITRVDGDNGSRNVYGTLARTRLDDQVISELRGAMSGTSSGIDASTIKIFADLGITIERNGSYKFDQDKFEEAIASDPQATANLLGSFAEKTASTNGLIDQYTRFQGLIDRAQRSNEQSSKIFQDRIERMERAIESQEQSLRRMFANLEQRVGALNASGAALNSVLIGLNQQR